MTQMQRDLLIWVVIPVVYSIGFFSWCYLAEKMPIFSKRNARSTPTVVCGHVVVLLILILLAQVAVDFYSSFPGWLIEPSHSARGVDKFSLFDVVCFASVPVIALIEMRWVYIDSEAVNSASESDRS